jgi:CheY-like chemotaxis protein
MNVVIIEDDVRKCEQLADFFRDLFPAMEVTTTFSFQSGAEAIERLTPELVILDMTIPTYDSENDEGRIRTFGGVDILAEMELLGLKTAAIVVSQFQAFAEGHEYKTLQELSSELFKEFGEIYLGAVYYHPSQTDWRPELQVLLVRFLERLGVA